MMMMMMVMLSGDEEDADGDDDDVEEGGDGDGGDGARLIQSYGENSLTGTDCMVMSFLILVFYSSCPY